MVSYTTLDYLPDLSASARASALPLTFAVASPNSVGWDYSAFASGFEPFALLHSVYRFTAIEGASYDIGSLSVFDPYLLLLYDAQGNAIVANDEADDPAAVTLSDGGTYSFDALFQWRAPYSGTFYVDASWNQGTVYPYYSLSVYEDRATAVANRAPVLVTPGSDLNWTEGKLVQYTVPAGTFSDPDGNALTYSAKQSNGSALPSWLSFDPATRLFLGTAPVGSGDITVRVTATDPGGLSAFDDMVFFTPAAAAGQTINGTALADKLLGGALADTLYGLAGDDYLDGGDGNDTMYGGDGNDTFDWSPDARGGDDRMEGGPGNDTYVINSAGDVVVEAANAGNDTLWTPLNYSLAGLPNVENLLAFGSTGLALTGNAAANSLSGSTGNDTLNGGGGNDRLDGKEGSDTAVFSGNFADYSVSYSTATGAYTVTDKLAGRDGTDTTVGIEFFSFKDGTRSAVASAFDTAPPLVQSFDPADEAVGVNVASNLTINFNEAVQRGSGNIVLKTTGGVVVETYNATSSANLTVSGSTLVVNPTANLAPGTSYRLEMDPGSIRDLAGNNFAGSTAYNFTTLAADDFVANAGTAGRVNVGQASSGNIDSGGDADWFAVSLVAGRSYQFKLDGVTLGDPYLSLYSPSSVLLGSDDDGGVGLNSLITFNVTTTGTYFLAARAAISGTGSYTLSAIQVASDDFGGNSATNGRLAAGGSITGNLETVSDEDWFAITLTAGQAYRFQLAGNTLVDPLLAIVSPTGVVLDFDDDGAGNLDARLDFTPSSSGTYYLGALAALGSNGTGTYTLSAQVLARDDFAANAGTTGRVTVGSTSAGNVEAGGDVDWFAVSLTAGQNYQLRAQGNTLDDPALALYSASGQLLLFDDDSGAGLDPLINFLPSSSGTYYLAVSGYEAQTGSYVVSAQRALADDYADTSSTTGRVATGGNVSGSIENPDDEDWFAVTLTAGQSYQIRMDGGLGSNPLADPLLGLYAASGTLLAYDDDSGGGTSALISYTATTSGTYYIDATAYGTGTGSYKVSVSGGGSGGGGGGVSDDFAASTATSGRVSVGGSASGRIESANDNDWFAVTLTAGQAYQFKLSGNGQTDPVLTLYSSTGSALASDDDSGGGLNAQLGFTPTASGTYYLGARMDSGGTGSYTLAAQTQAVATDSAFTIRVQYGGDPRYQSYFTQAAARWSEIIVGDLPNVNDPQYGLIDDLLILASVEPIDGPGSILGQAGPTARRSAADGGLPSRGVMQFDSADLAAMEAAGTLSSVILHEMGHVLGIGTLFQSKGLVNGFNYIGANGVAAYRQLTGNLGLSSVPLETGGGTGTAGAHWLETLFNSELMTGYAETRPPMPLSIVTVGCLADLGYQVDYSAADPYVLGS